MASQGSDKFEKASKRLFCAIKVHVPVGEIQLAPLPRDAHGQLATPPRSYRANPASNRGPAFIYSFFNFLFPSSECDVHVQRHCSCTLHSTCTVHVHVGVVSLLTLARTLALPMMITPYLARVRATLRRRASFRNPMPWCLLALTQERMKSFSLPWKTSTLATSSS